MSRVVDRFIAGLMVGPHVEQEHKRLLMAFEELEHAFKVCGSDLSVGSLRIFLLQRSSASSLAQTTKRLSLIAKFVATRPRAEEPHPLLTLTRRHGGRIAPIAQALLQEDYEEALRRLVPLPVWGSVLGPLMRNHVSRMQALGHRYDSKKDALKRFDRFLQMHVELEPATLDAQLEAWRLHSRNLRHQYEVQQCGRSLHRELQRHGTETSRPPIDIHLYGRMVGRERRPHVFGEADIVQLLRASDTFRMARIPLRDVMVRAMITLAYCSGLRVGELAALRVGDFDTDAGSLEIIETKFFKSRRLPLSNSALKVLNAYLGQRAESGAPNDRDSPLWWCARRRSGYGLGAAAYFLTEAMRRAGLKPSRGVLGPRVHDLRHTFVAHRMLQWYREGIEPQGRLQYLATYLGHKDIRSTLAYMHAQPDLLQHASERYRERGVAALQTLGERK